ncbi:hypothetical protein OGAPHI_005392 [Ogataea philodendri]|uniref:NADP-dependent oxidoreductase domain-containing protein n=1 Tax=Ogataea philodendri TaxID=1378263 RepID=A0A9P8P246_9ASCO|nr:uncharacterized protein OGAPHI_005392 [Ogataea philodendri]KAH3663402.1 hypothetical protein OGAPHI_005392 [Ogataea philodendri]
MTPYQVLNTGARIPQVGLGVYKITGPGCSKLVYAALAAGYRHVDSAAFYQNEAEVCKGISQWLADNPGTKREDIFYTSKIWDTDHGYDKATKAIAQALERASPIGYIDLLLIHSPQSNYEARHGTWLALQEAFAKGTVKNIGVSNYGIKHLEELLAYPDLKVKPAINQFEVHPWLGRKELIAFCRSKGIAVEAYSPLARGQKANDPYVAEIGKKYGRNAGQVLIRWSVQNGLIVLPKTATESRLASNLDVDFTLSDEDFAALSALDEHYVSGWDPTTYPLDSEATLICT